MTLEEGTCVICGESLYDEGKSPRVLNKIASSNFKVWADIEPGTVVCSGECQAAFQGTFTSSPVPASTIERSTSSATGALARGLLAGTRPAKRG